MGIGTTTRDLAARVQGRLQELGVHPGHADHIAGVDGVGPERGLVDRRNTPDQADRRTTTDLHRGSPGRQRVGSGRVVAGGPGPKPHWPSMRAGHGLRPAGGLPPTGGGWWLYHSFSTQFTTGAPPCPRTHSEKRAPTELPRAGLSRAPPSETASQPMTLQRARTRTTLIRRRRWTVEPFERPSCAPGVRDDPVLRSRLDSSAGRTSVSTSFRTMLGFSYDVRSDEAPDEDRRERHDERDRSVQVVSPPRLMIG